MDLFATLFSALFFTLPMAMFLSFLEGIFPELEKKLHMLLLGRKVDFNVVVLYESLHGKYLLRKTLLSYLLTLLFLVFYQLS